MSFRPIPAAAFLLLALVASPHTAGAADLPATPAAVLPAWAAAYATNEGPRTAAL